MPVRRSSSAETAARFQAMRQQTQSASWSAAKRAALARDGKCQKCWATAELQVHHIKERVNGGTDGLENLLTLCSDCHAEWTFLEDGSLKFDAWRKLPPSRTILPLFALEWPTDISADAFKQQILNSIAWAMVNRGKAK